MAEPRLDSIHRALFAAYPDALLLVDADGQVVMANPAAAALLGYALDELVGLPVDALVPEAVRARHAGYRAAYGHTPQPRPMGLQMDLVARRRDGTEVMVEIALSPLQDHGLPLVVAAIRGIGAYPRVQQALQRARYSECVAEMGRLAVDSRDPQRLLREVPAVAARTLQADVAVLYRVQPGAQDLRIAAVHGPAGSEAEGRLRANRPDTPWGYAMARGEPVVVTDYASESRFAVPPELIQLGLVSALDVPLADRGRITGVLSVRARQARRFGEDEVRFLQSLANLLASSLQRADSEEALAHSQKMESIGQLTGGIAHDFNNLLTIILGNLQVLEDLPAAQDEGARDLVSAAMRAGKRGADLTAKLLAFSRRQVLQPTRVDVAAQLGSLADMLRRTLDQRIRIAVHAPAEGAVARADASQLESALLNLAINARDAMPEGGLLTFEAVTDGEFVAISVADTGSGMSEQVRERAFEPFFTTKEKGRGTGLGLSTVYGFVSQSSGTVRIDSAPGRGTTVTLRIPRWRDAGDDDNAAPDATTLPPGLRVLLVEDDAEVRKVVEAFLRGLRCTVRSAADAEEALRVLEAHAAFDVLLSDVSLGAGARGTELARRATLRRPRLSVLLMSGYADELLALEPDAQSWELLHKPFTREDLAAALARALP